MEDNAFIERKIIIGMIVSDDYLRQIRSVYNVRFLKSTLAKRIAGWCVEYFDKFNKAPKLDIEIIYYQKLKLGIPEDLAEEIEQDILPELSEEFVLDGINVPYLLEQTNLYFQEQHLEVFVESIKGSLLSGEILKAQQEALNYKMLDSSIGDSINLAKGNVSERVERAFAEAAEPLIVFPKALGLFWNHQLTRGAFVALMGIEKRGKTFWLLEFAARAVSQKRKVVFFQAGDMTETQQIRRLAIYLAKKSDREEYMGIHYEPIRDCVLNQLNECDLAVRECDFGVFTGLTKQQIRKQMTFDKLKEAYDENKDYNPCFNCKKYHKVGSNLGAVWLKKVQVSKVLQVNEAVSLFESYFVENKRQFMLSTHANGTLSVSKIKSLLDIWEKQENFIPDVIVIDYADILASESKVEFRHQQNEIWRGLRSLTQERHCLLITATQADAAAYDKDLLSLRNFSEDKRKFAHVTAMYGLNQDPHGREKQLGVMRINEIVIREGDSNPMNVAWVLQNLKRGRPFMQSFF